MIDKVRQLPTFVVFSEELSVIFWVVRAVITVEVVASTLVVASTEGGVSAAQPIEKYTHGKEPSQRLRSPSRPLRYVAQSVRAVVNSPQTVQWWLSECCSNSGP